MRGLSRIAQLDQRTALPDPMSALGGSERAAPQTVTFSTASTPFQTFPKVHVSGRHAFRFAGAQARRSPAQTAMLTY